MKPEHVRLTPAENIYGKKNLLHMRLGLITVLQRIEAYRKLRTEELMFKIALKNKVEETRGALFFLQRILPKPTIAPTENNLKKEEQQKKEKLSLEQEVEEIKQKLSRLR